MRLRLPGPGPLGIAALFVLVITVALSLYLPYRVEQRVLDDLTDRLGFAVETDVEMIGPASLNAYRDQEWLAWFRRVRRVRIESNGRGNNYNLGQLHLDQLHHCDRVCLAFFQIEADDMQGIRASTRLRQLEFEYGSLTSDALLGLDGHPNLREIAIMNSEIGDRILLLPSVSTLTAFRGNGAGVFELDVSRTPDLRRIEVKNCVFDDRGAARLADAPKLEVLMMPATRISDAAIDDLLQLKSLRYLDLRLNNQLSAEAVAKLSALPKLGTVNLWFSVPETEELQQSLPQAVWRQTP